jgi:hypothetical protein
MQQKGYPRNGSMTRKKLNGDVVQLEKEKVHPIDKWVVSGPTMLAI